MDATLRELRTHREPNHFLYVTGLQVQGICPYTQELRDSIIEVCPKQEVSRLPLKCALAVVCLVSVRVPQHDSRMGGLLVFRS